MTPQVMETYSNREPTDCFCSSYTCFIIGAVWYSRWVPPLFCIRLICHAGHGLGTKQLLHKALETYSSREPTAVSIPQIPVLKIGCQNK